MNNPLFDKLSLSLTSTDGFDGEGRQIYRASASAQLGVVFAPLIVHRRSFESERDARQQAIVELACILKDRLAERLCGELDRLGFGSRQ